LTLHLVASSFTLNVEAKVVKITEVQETGRFALFRNSRMEEEDGDVGLFFAAGGT
jgi:hypothetical protein